MAVYSRVIGAGADTSLTALLSGAAIVLVLMLVLRHTRNRTIAAAQPRLSATFAMALVARYLRLAGRRPSLDGARAHCPFMLMFWVLPGTHQRSPCGAYADT